MVIGKPATPEVRRNIASVLMGTGSILWPWFLVLLVDQYDIHQGPKPAWLFFILFFAGITALYSTLSKWEQKDK